MYTAKISEQKEQTKGQNSRKKEQKKTTYDASPSPPSPELACASSTSCQRENGETTEEEWGTAELNASAQRTSAPSSSDLAQKNSHEPNNATRPAKKHAETKQPANKMGRARRERRATRAGRTTTTKTS
jgi:hypothetical protein